MNDLELIKTYVDLRRGVDGAALYKSAVPIWAIVGHLTAAKQDIGRVAKDYGISEDEVRAAVAYYRAHAAAIDARIEANAV